MALLEADPWQDTINFLFPQEILRYPSGLLTARKCILRVCIAGEGHAWSEYSARRRVRKVTRPLRPLAYVLAVFRSSLIPYATEASLLVSTAWIGRVSYACNRSRRSRSSAAGPHPAALVACPQTQAGARPCHRPYVSADTERHL